MSTSAAPSFPAPRVAPNLPNAFGGVLRLALYRFSSPSQWLWTAGLILLTALLSVTSTHPHDKSDFLGWITEFYIAFLLPALAFLSGGGAMRDEMKGNAVDYILTRPIPRWAYLSFRYVAQWLNAQISYLLVFCVIIGVGVYRHIPDLGTDLPLVFLAQILSITVFTAFGFLCGVLTNRYVVVGLIYGAVVEIGFGRIPIQLSELSMTHQLRSLLHLLQSGEPRLLATVQTCAVLLAVTLGMLTLAAAIFANRELAGARPSDT